MIDDSQRGPRFTLIVLAVAALALFAFVSWLDIQDTALNQRVRAVLRGKQK